jgi:hypothetical protein
MYIVYGSIIGLQYFGGMWSVDTPKSWYSSMTTSGASFYEWMGYTRDLTKSAVDGDYADWKEYATTGIISFFGLSLFYVFIIAPLMAGFWTGPKTKKHKFHRYMGLLYLLQYFLAWVEFLTNYTNGAAASYLPHFIALNGTLRGNGSGKKKGFYPMDGRSLWMNTHVLLIFVICSLRHSPGYICLLFVQGIARVGRSWILFRQGCLVAELCAREYLFHAHVHLWLGVLQRTGPRNSALQRTRPYH